MSSIVTVAVTDVKNAFMSMNDNNKLTMEKLISEIETKGFAGDDEDRLELQKLRDKTLYQYMDTLVNTAKIEMEAKMKQVKIANSDSLDGRLLTTISQIQDSVTELKETTMLKIQEESQ